jgi:hypothetical protein
MSHIPECKELLAHRVYRTEVQTLLDVFMS